MEAIEGQGKDKRIVPTLAHFRIAESMIRVDPADYEKFEEDIGDMFRDAAISVAESLYVEWGDDLPKELRPTFIDIDVDDESDLKVVQDD